jgi:muramidase (phage lysozyme)
MNGRVRAIGSGLLVTATSVALVGVATAAADDAPSHPEAAHAAATRTGGSAGSPAAAAAAIPTVDPAVQARNDQVVVQKFAAAVAAANLDRFYAAVTANIEREHAAAAARAAHRTSTGSSASSGSSVLDCIRHRESRGQYDVVNTSSGAAGAYQFMPGTWNTNAAAAGRPDLVGVNPANASPADQDAMAQHLLATQGLGPWGGSCG